MKLNNNIITYENNSQNHSTIGSSDSALPGSLGGHQIRANCRRTTPDRYISDLVNKNINCRKGVYGRSQQK